MILHLFDAAAQCCAVQPSAENWFTFAPSWMRRPQTSRCPSRADSRSGSCPFCGHEERLEIAGFGRHLHRPAPLPTYLWIRLAHRRCLMDALSEVSIKRFTRQDERRACTPFGQQFRSYVDVHCWALTVSVCWRQTDSSGELS